MGRLLYRRAGGAGSALALVLALAVLAAGVAGTAEAFNRDFKLERTGEDPDAIGRVEVDKVAFNKPERLLKVRMFNLEPGGVYTVWVVSERYGRKIAGVRKNHFRAGSEGAAVYKFWGDEYRLHLKTLEVAWHPDGDPGNTEEMVVVLRGLITL